MAEITQASVVKNRQNPKLKAKKEIYKLLDDSYAGGQQYIDGNHLVKYVRESDPQFKARKARSVYFNHVQPLVDLLIGFVFTRPPQRTDMGDLDYLLTDASKGQGLDEFMFNLATQSIMMTCGVLVDAPFFEKEKVLSKSDRKEKGLNPYCLMYTPDRIRDFAFDDKGILLWVLLDNSITDNTDPYKNPIEKVVYRLWTREYYQDFDYTKKDSPLTLEKVPHIVKKVPFRFLNWRDKNQDKITDTIFEDIALYDKAIYNFMSCMDEMITGGTFKLLFFPAEDVEDDIPQDIKVGGISNLSVIAFNGQIGTPFFAGPGLGDVVPFIAAIELYLTEILKKIGVESAEEQSIVKTGVARRYDFEKTKAYIVSGIKQLELMETFIFETCHAWEGKYNETVPKSVYYTDFLSEDLNEKINRFMRLSQLGYVKLKKSLHKALVKASVGSDIEKEEMAEILKEIDESVEATEPLDIKQLVNNIKANGEPDE